MKPSALLLSTALVALGGNQLFAHHSFGATYDSSQHVEIEGTVKEFVWRNPHSFLRVDVKGPDGQTQTWALEWGSISQLSSSSLSRTTLKPGDRVIVSGQPARDQSSPRLLIVNIARPADGWEWKGSVE